MSMDSAYGADELRRQLRSVRSDLEELNQAVDDVKRTVDDLEVENLPEKISSLRYDVGEVEEKVDRVEADLSSDIDDSRRLLKRLATRVEWLERHIRHSPDTETVDFDDDTPETRRLVRTVELGLDAEAGLLTVAQRQGLQAAINRHQAAVRERDAHHQVVLKATETLAGTLPQHKRHTQAAAEFRAAVPKVRQALQDLPLLAMTAAEAREELAEDDTNRARQARVINAARKATQRLHGQMRGRLTNALNRQVMLPTWFVTVLGPLPPAKDTDVWMETATKVLVYRATYQVTDPIVALGPRPDGHRLRLTERYERRSRDLRRWAN
ncbi:CopG family transcriptional regulator [Streptomyces sp. NPDC001514]